MAPVARRIVVEARRRRMSMFSAIPWTLLLIGYMVVVHYTAHDMTGVTGYVFIGLGIGVLFAEFFKSGDINALAFLVDLVGAVAAVIVATVLMCYIYFQMGQMPTFFHWFGSAIILGDAILSPFNAFRTALRNLGLGAP
jgi:hypothetical protein